MELCAEQRAFVCVSEREGARGDLAVCAVEAIEALPLANTPEVFGLHPNAEIGYYTQAARDLWSHLLELQPQTGSPPGGARPGPGVRQGSASGPLSFRHAAALPTPSPLAPCLGPCSPSQASCL